MSRERNNKNDLAGVFNIFKQRELTQDPAKCFVRSLSRSGLPSTSVDCWDWSQLQLHGRAGCGTGTPVLAGPKMRLGWFRIFDLRLHVSSSATKNCKFKESEGWWVSHPCGLMQVMSWSSGHADKFLDWNISPLQDVTGLHKCAKCKKSNHDKWLWEMWDLVSPLKLMLHLLLATDLRCMLHDHQGVELL